MKGTEFDATFELYTDEELIVLARGDLNQYDRTDIINLVLEMAQRLRDLMDYGMGEW